MPATSTIAEFIRFTEQSGLLEKSRLDAYLKRLDSEGLTPQRPAELGGFMVRDGLLTNYQAQQLLHGHWHRFTLLGKYRILEVIGVGGMGKVFLCEHMLLRRLVAVKVLPIAKTGNAMVVERFYREARAIASLNHPNIVRCFDIDRDGMLHFMVMEYVDGASLDTIVGHHGPMDITRAAHYVSQAANGLQHAHEAGWVHRDIKPGNVLLERTGVVKLLDMGLARLFTDEVDNLTQQHSGQTILGTADYIAPEQAVASHEVDIRADIYSLGATFYFVLCGRALFHEGTIAQKLIWHQMRDPDPITKWRREVPAALAAVVKKMLAKDAASRYQIPREIAEALKPWTAQPIGPPSPLEMPRGDPLVQGMNSSGSAAALMAVSSAGYAIPDGGSMGGPPPSTVDNRAGATTWESAKPPAVSPIATQRRASPSAPTISVTVSGTSTKTPSNIELPLSASRERLGSPKAPPSTIRRTGPLAPFPEKKPLGEALPAPAKPPGRRGRFALVLLGAAPLLLTGLFAVWYLGTNKGQTATPPFASNSKPATQPTSPSGRPALLVTRNRSNAIGEQPNTFDSVERALAQAREGDRILLLDQFYEERLVVDGNRQKFAANVTIASSIPGGKATVWRLPANVSENTALITLANVTGLHIEGIAFDGERRIDELIALSGRCPGLHLEQIQLNGFRRTAICFSGCKGDSALPVALRQVRIMAGSAETVSALQMKGLAKADTCQNIVVRECRLEGPFKSAVQLNTSLSGVQFHGNRIFRAGAALGDANQDPHHHVGVSFVSNTFCEMDVFLQLQTLPLDNSKEICIRLENNLFARTKMSLVGALPKNRADLPQIFGAAASNVSDGTMATSSLADLPMQLMSFDLPTDPNVDSRFLRYARTSKLAQSGLNNGPVGAGAMTE